MIVARAESLSSVLLYFLLYIHRYQLSLLLNSFYTQTVMSSKCGSEYPKWKRAHFLQMTQPSTKEPNFQNTKKIFCQHFSMQYYISLHKKMSCYMRRYKLAPSVAFHWCHYTPGMIIDLLWTLYDDYIQSNFLHKSFTSTNARINSLAKSLRQMPEITKTKNRFAIKEI